MLTEPEKNAIACLLSKKKLAPEFFFSSSRSVEAPLEDHVAWAYDHIYSKSYPSSSYDNYHALPRAYHGIAHVTRAALYARVWIKLYRKYGDSGALALTDHDAHLLQLALLFHDAAREDDGVDRWDHESGLLLYYYCVYTLSIPSEQARMLAEAVANKDSTSTYQRLAPQPNGTLAWVSLDVSPCKTIYQKIIHDADCLDIIRARKIFEADYLDFYQDIAQHNMMALKDMAELITEARSLIAAQGDDRHGLDYTLKQQYDSPQCYQHTLACLAQQAHNPYLLINALYRSPLTQVDSPEMPVVNLPAYDAKQPMDTSNLQAAMREGKVFARGIVTPSERAPYPRRRDETFAQIEVRKMMRRPDQQTQTDKSSKISKHGNPLRSAVLVTYSSGVFSCAGYLLIDPPKEIILQCFDVDANTGRRNNKSSSRYPQIPLSEKEAQLATLQVQHMKGGKTRADFPEFNNHNEVILSCITHVDAVYFTPDSTYHGRYGHVSSLLQAVYLQQVYEKKTGIKLPLIRYSWTHHTLILQEELTESQLLEYWTTLCQDWLETKKSSFAYTLDVEKIKRESLYKKAIEEKNYRNSPTAYYTKTFQQQLNDKIKALIAPYCAQHLIKDPSLLDKPDFTTQLLFLSELTETVTETITLYTEETLLMRFNTKPTIENLKALIAIYAIANNFNLIVLEEKIVTALRTSTLTHLEELIEKHSKLKYAHSGDHLELLMHLDQCILLDNELIDNDLFHQAFVRLIADHIEKTLALMELNHVSNFLEKINQTRYHITEDEKKLVINVIFSKELKEHRIGDALKLLYLLQAPESLIEKAVKNFFTLHRKPFELNTYESIRWLACFPSSSRFFEDNTELFAHLVENLGRNQHCRSTGIIRELLANIDFVIKHALHDNITPKNLSIINKRVTCFLEWRIKNFSPNHNHYYVLLESSLEDAQQMNFTPHLAPMMVTYLTEKLSTWKTENIPYDPKLLYDFLQNPALATLARESGLLALIELDSEATDKQAPIMMVEPVESTTPAVAEIVIVSTQPSVTQIAEVEEPSPTLATNEHSEPTTPDADQPLTVVIPPHVTKTIQEETTSVIIEIPSASSTGQTEPAARLAPPVRMGMSIPPSFLSAPQPPSSSPEQNSLQCLKNAIKDGITLYLSHNPNSSTYKAPAQKKAKKGFFCQVNIRIEPARGQKGLRRANKLHDDVEQATSENEIHALLQKLVNKGGRNWDENALKCCIITEICKKQRITLSGSLDRENALQVLESIAMPTLNSLTHS